MFELYKEEVKELINNGEFELELIAFEYNIPQEIVLQWKNELEREKHYKKTTVQEKKDIEVHKKVNEIIERFAKLYNKRENNKKQSMFDRKITEEQVELFKRYLFNMKKNMMAFKKVSSNSEKTIISRKILDDFSALDKYQKSMKIQLPIEIIDEYIDIFYSRELEAHMEIIKNGTIKLNHKNAKNIIGIELSKFIEREMLLTDDIEELETLLARITPELLKGSLILNTTKTKIESKIRLLQKDSRLNDFKNNIPSNIDKVIVDLVNGRLDIQKAKDLINEEAEERTKKRPQKSPFPITIEQEIRQILIQIKTAIREQPEEYTIINPETTITQMHALCGGEIEQIVGVVVTQKINLNELEEAKNICNKYAKGKAETVRYINGLLKQINTAETTQLILKGINKATTLEEKEQFFNIVAAEMEMEKATGCIRLGGINLGKNKNGTKKITFADIWSDKKAKTLEK